MNPRLIKFVVSLYICLSFEASAQIYSWEEDLEGWGADLPNAVATSTIGATDGLQSLEVSQPNDNDHMWYSVPTFIDLTAEDLQSIFTGATELHLDVSYPNPGYNSWFGDASVEIIIQGENVGFIGLGVRDVVVDAPPETVTFPLSVAQADGMATSGWGQILLKFTYGNGGSTSPDAVFYVDNMASTVVTDPSPVSDLFWKGDVDNDWSSLNWTSDLEGTLPGGALPLDGSAGIAFAAAGAANLDTVLGVDQHLASLVLTDGVEPVSIGGSSNLTLGSGGIWTETSAGALSINTTGNVVLNGDQVWKNKSAAAMTVDSQISGSGTLTKSGAGPVHLNNANLHTGGNIVEQGTLVIGDPLALGATSNTLDMVGGILDLNGWSPTLSGVAGAFGTAIHNGSATPSVLTLDIPTATTYGCSINDGPGGGGVSVVKQGSGSVDATGGSGFTGSLTIDDGVFTASAASYGAPNFTSFGAAQSAGRQIIVNSPGEVELNNIYVLGTTAGDPSLLPEFVLNGSSMNTLRFNIIGDVTLNGAVLTQSTTDTGTNQGYQFMGRIKVEGDSSSVINGFSGTANHLASSTQFDVEDVTGDEDEDLIVEVRLIDQAGDLASAPGGLTKDGAGTMVLQAENSYSGDTVIDGGTLSVWFDSFNDTSTIRIASSGATLNLDTIEAVDVVGGLVIGGVAKADGLYRASTENGGAGEGTVLPQLTGDGKLQVVTPPATGYAEWAMTNVGDQEVDEDFNNDGVANGIAYFMDETGPIVLPGVTDGSITWTNGGLIPASDYGTQYLLETSQDLEDWTMVELEDLDLNEEGPEGELSYTLPTGLGIWFVRLVVTPN